jgi:hypothetical protein
VSEKKSSGNEVTALRKNLLLETNIGVKVPKEKNFTLTGDQDKDLYDKKTPG